MKCAKLYNAKLNTNFTIVHEYHDSFCWGGGGGGGGVGSDFCLHGTHCEGRGLFYTGRGGGGGDHLLHCYIAAGVTGPKPWGGRGYCYSPSSTWRCAVNQCCPLSSSAPLPPAPNERVRHPGGGGVEGGSGAGTADTQTQPVCLSARGSNVPPSSALPNDTGNQRPGKRPTQLTVPSSPVYYL